MVTKMTYVQYDKKEHNTTVGMPALAAVESINDESKSSNDNELSVSEDVYAFIIVCPVTNSSFWIALYIIILKYALYAILFSGININSDASIFNSTPKVQAVKFFLIPVAVAMQEDLIQVYEDVANLKYDEKVLEVSQSATKGKLIFASILRLIDGSLSLAVNFYVMLTTDVVLNVFLNFAALHFLQGIDNVFFELVKKGFFGDVMEMMSDVCRRVHFPRRESNKGFVREVDTILLTLTLSICLAIYGVVTWQTSVGTWQSS